jgi:hypothetical protein
MASSRVPTAAEAAAGADPAAAGAPAAPVSGDEPYPQPKGNEGYNNPDCGFVPDPDWSDKVDTILALVTSEAPPRAFETARVWPVGTVVDDLLFHSLPDEDEKALTSRSKPFGRYDPADVLPSKLQPSKGATVGDAVALAVAEAESAAVDLDSKNLNEVTHYWMTCTGNLSNLASRISYYLYRCDKYKAWLQLINCIEAREREQDHHRKKQLNTALARAKFMSHVVTINKLYALLFQLKNTLRRAPPSAVSVTYATTGSSNFSVGVDPGTEEEINAYSQRQGALRAAVAGIVDDKGNRLTAIVRGAQDAADPYSSYEGPPGGPKRGKQKGKKGGKGPPGGTRRKNGRRRTQKKRKTYV